MNGDPVSYAVGDELDDLGLGLDQEYQEFLAADLLENKDVQRAYLGKDKKEIWER